MIDKNTEYKQNRARHIRFQ